MDTVIMHTRTRFDEQFAGEGYKQTIHRMEGAFVCHLCSHGPLPAQHFLC